MSNYLIAYSSISNDLLGDSSLEATLTSAPCNTSTILCDYGRIETDGSGGIVSSVNERTTKETGGVSWANSSYPQNVTEAANSTFITTKVKLTYAINTPSDTSILQQMSLLDDEFEIYLNQQLADVAVSVVNFASFLGASSISCIAKDTQHVCAVASSTVILSQDATTHVNTTRASVDPRSTSIERRYTSFPLTSQQFQYAILQRMKSYTQMKTITIDNNRETKLSLITPMPISTNVVLQFTSNDDDRYYFTRRRVMSQEDIQWLEWCATNFIQQHITNSGVVSSIIPLTTFALVANETVNIDDWFPTSSSLSTSDKNTTTSSSSSLYLNLFVAGQYNALLQNNSNFDLAIQELFHRKGVLLLQKLTQPDDNNVTDITPFFNHLDSIKLIVTTRSTELETTAAHKQQLSTTATLLLCIFVLGGIFLYCVVFIYYKLPTDFADFCDDDDQNQQKIETDIQLDRQGTASSFENDNHEIYNDDDENQPLSPKQKIETTPKKPNNHLRSFSDAIMRHVLSSSEKKKSLSPKPNNNEEISNCSSSASSSSRSSNLRSRLNQFSPTQGGRVMQTPMALKMDFGAENSTMPSA